jgi:hypothetical protein
MQSPLTHRRSIPAVVLCFFLATGVSLAQSQRVDATAPSQPAPPAQPVTPGPGSGPSSASDAPAAPATITLINGTLSVSARNSDLNSILQEIAHASGMTIDGLGKSTRVFGVYGPGNPRDVLTDLLAGSGYNFAMLGGGNGIAPARLVLTAQSAAPPKPAHAERADSSDSDDVDSDDADQDLGPGAIVHPGPQAFDNSDSQTRAQRYLQRVEQMRQQMQQQEQDNPQ